MKIIVEGKLVEESSTYAGVCKKCECVFECDKDELKTKWVTYGIGVMEHERPVQYVVCPTQGCFSHVVPVHK